MLLHHQALALAALPMRSSTTANVKPIEFDKATQNFRENRLLLLNSSMTGIRYVNQPISLCNTSIRSNGGIALPRELWAVILSLRPVTQIMSSVSFRHCLRQLSYY